MNTRKRNEVASSRREKTRLRQTQSEFAIRVDYFFIEISPGKGETESDSVRGSRVDAKTERTGCPIRNAGRFMLKIKLVWPQSGKIASREIAWYNLGPIRSSMGSLLEAAIFQYICIDLCTMFYFSSRLTKGYGRSESQGPQHLFVNSLVRRFVKSLFMSNLPTILAKTMRHVQKQPKISDRLVLRGQIMTIHSSIFSAHQTVFSSNLSRYRHLVADMAR